MYLDRYFHDLPCECPVLPAMSFVLGMGGAAITILMIEDSTWGRYSCVPQATSP